MNKTVKIIIVSALALLVLTAVIFGIIYWHQEHRMEGRLVFDHAYDAGNSVDRIDIINHNSKIELIKKDDYWTLKNFNGYHADFSLISDFLETINNSHYMLKVSVDDNKMNDLLLGNPDDAQQNAGIIINIYANGDKIDDLIVGVKDSERGYFFARKSNSREVWLVSGDYNIPYSPKEWLPNPIIELPESSIEMLSIDGNLIARQMAMEDFRDRLDLKVNVSWLLQNLASLNVEDILPQNIFEERFPETGIAKIYDIVTFYGLLFELNFYRTVDKDVWVNIKLLPDGLAAKVVSDYIKENSFLYDGWYFKISPLQKDFFMNYRLM